MKPLPVPSPGSERGIALIVVLLLMAVMTGLATGFAMNSRVEVAMGENELYYAGARGAAEAGLNRAIEAVKHNTSTDFLKGHDGDVSTTADNGSISWLLTGTSPYALGTSAQYSYVLHIYDDDDPALYTAALTSAQILAMGEGVSGPYVDVNNHLILRATGYGPKGTSVTVARVLESVDTSVITTTPGTTTVTNPAILVNGNLSIGGHPTVSGTNGSIHANGNLSITGNATSISQDATASGTFSANNNWHAGHSEGGGRPAVTVPNINAHDYIGQADYILTSTGNLTTPSGTVVCVGNNSGSGGCNGYGWKYVAATGWKVSGNTITSATYYAQTDITITGNPHGPLGETDGTPVSIIAEGSITLSGNPYFLPENSMHLQYVTDKDLKITGNVNEEGYEGQLEGQSLVREQFNCGGNPNLRGQVIIQNVTSTSSLVTTNTITGAPNITYNGSFGGVSTTTGGTTSTSIAYVNNVIGWIE